MDESSTPMLGGIEAGGTKFVLAIGARPDRIGASHEIPTRDPASTLAEAAEWFARHGRIDALGIASFGPVGVDPRAPDWGRVLATPKPGWSGCDMAGFFARRFGVPIGFDTDVNGAALAECRYGFAGEIASLAYVTVGTGIGGGMVIDGAPVHGAAHPEMGHMFVRRDPRDSDFAGICPHHGDCLEGLASGPAIKARWGVSLSELPQDHIAHSIEAEYLAQLCQAVFAIASPQRVVLGGGVMKTPGLLDRVVQRAGEIDGGYLPGGAARAIIAPTLQGASGATGALLLGQEALARAQG